MVDGIDYVTAAEAFQAVLSSTIIFVSGATRLQMKERAALSDWKALGRTLPSRSRIKATHWRLPFWLRRRRLSTRFSLWLAGLTWPPKYPPSFHDFAGVAKHMAPLAPSDEWHQLEILFRSKTRCRSLRVIENPRLRQS